MTQPVFVDASGRRARWFVRLCWAVATLFAVYVGLVILSLLAPPGLTRLGLGPLLPQVKAPALSGPAGGKQAPKQALEPTSGPSPAVTPVLVDHPTPASSGTGRGGTRSTAPSPAPRRSTTTAPQPGRSPAPRPTVAPSVRPSHPHPTHSPHR